MGVCIIRFNLTHTVHYCSITWSGSQWLCLEHSSLFEVDWVTSNRWHDYTWVGVCRCPPQKKATFHCSFGEILTRGPHPLRLVSQPPFACRDILVVTGEPNRFLQLVIRSRAVFGWERPSVPSSVNCRICFVFKEKKNIRNIVTKACGIQMGIDVIRLSMIVFLSWR